MVDTKEPNVAHIEGNGPVPLSVLKRACVEHLEIELDPERSAFWFLFSPKPVPCFNPGVLKEILAVQNPLIHSGCRVACDDGRVIQVRWVVVGSLVPGVFNLGGDLALFMDAIERQDRQALFDYAVDCIDTIFNHASGYGDKVATISLVQGRALGGGLECALASGTIVAERQAMLGLPEMFFNLFPGMGAYNLLVRRIPGSLANTIVTDAKQWSADQMLEWGVVDKVVEDGTGRQAVNDLIDRQGYGGVVHAKMKRIHHRVSYDELMHSIVEWTDAAMRLSERDLKAIKRFRKAQGGLGASETSEDDT